MATRVKTFRSIAAGKVGRQNLKRLQSIQQLQPLFKETRRKETIKEARRENLKRARSIRDVKVQKRRAFRARRENILLPTARAVKQSKIKGAVKSSNLWKLGYDASKEIMIAEFNTGTRYRYFDVPFSAFDQVVKGRAHPLTTGSNKWGSWDPQKYPSIGAAFHKYIKLGGYKFERIAEFEFERGLGFLEDDGT